VPVIGAAASAEHIQLRKAQPQFAILSAQFFRVSSIEVGA
jgi:hypothetical protein